MIMGIVIASTTSLVLSASLANKSILEPTAQNVCSSHHFKISLSVFLCCKVLMSLSLKIEIQTQHVVEKAHVRVKMGCVFALEISQVIHVRSV